VAVVREAGAREAAEARLAGKTKADYSRWIVCFFITQQKKQATSKEIACQYLYPRKDITRAILRIAEG
jgi:hypothetical protein